MADCFWTDLVGVAQSCESAPVGPSGYVLMPVQRGSGPVAYSPGLGRAFHATTLSDRSILSFDTQVDGDYTDQWYDTIATFDGSTCAVAASDSMAVALGSMSMMSTPPFSIDAIVTTDGISTTRYADVIPLDAMGYVFGVAYHPERGKFYGLIGSGDAMQVYEMGATAATWTVVLTISANAGAVYGRRPTITYLPGTHEIVVLAETGGAVHAYSLGATGGFVDHTPSGFTLDNNANPESVVNIAYCTGAAKYVVLVTGGPLARVLLASASLDGAFTATGLTAGPAWDGGFIVSPSGENYVMWGDWRMCGNAAGGSTEGGYYPRILASSNLVDATVLYAGLTRAQMDEAANNGGYDQQYGIDITTGADVYGFVPGAAPGTGMVFVDNYGYCS